MTAPETPARRRTRYPTAILVALAVVLLAELGLRVATPRLALVNEWNDWEATNKVAAMDVLAERGGASIVLVGSSMMNAAADVETLTRLRGGGRPVFNASLNGAGGRVLDFFTLRVVVPRLRPRIVVIGVSSRDLNDNGVDALRLYRLMLRSIGGRTAAARLSPTQHIAWIGERLSYLVRYRSRLRRPTSLFKADPREAVDAVGPFGTLFKAQVPRESATYRFNSRFQTEFGSRFFGRYAVGGIETMALRHLVSELSTAGIRVLLVEMPVAADVYGLHPNGMADYERFEASLGEIARQGVPSLDTTLSIKDPVDFADPLHVNGHGRLRFTQMLAEALQAM